MKTGSHIDLKAFLNNMSQANVNYGTFEGLNTLKCEEIFYTMTTVADILREFLMKQVSYILLESDLH